MRIKNELIKLHEKKNAFEYYSKNIYYKYNKYNIKIYYVLK